LAAADADASQTAAIDNSREPLPAVPEVPPPTAPAATPAEGAPPVTLSAEQLDYDGATRVFRARGGVVLEQEGLRLTADELFWQDSTRDVVANGQVRLADPGGELQGSNVTANLATGLGRVSAGRVFLRERNFHLTGTELERLGEASYRVTDGHFTTCDGAVPDWRFSAAQVDVDLGRYATARHVWFEVNNRPLLYLPYLVFPVKRERESGFLLPRAGYSSRKGTLLSLAWYEVIDRHLDATVYLDYLSRIGLGKGLEYRYVLGGDNRGEALLYHVSGINENSNSYALDWQHDGTLPGGVRLAANVEYVNKREYFEDFGETADEYNRDHTVSTLLMQRNWEKLNLTGFARYIKNLEGDNDTTLQRWPEFAMDVPFYRLETMPLYTSTELRATNFRRDTGAEGQRLFLRQGLGLVLKPGSWLEFSPEVAVYGRAYHGDSGDETDLLPEYGATLSTRLQRVFPFARWGIDRLQHSIEPQIRYRYIPDSDQEDLPLYDLNDRIGRISLFDNDLVGALNFLEYAVVNRLTARSTGADGTSAYRELINLRLSQAYDIEEKRDAAEDDPEPFSDLRTELGLYPTPATSLTLDARIRVYDGPSFSQVNAGAGYADGHGNGAQVSYSYRSAESGFGQTDYLQMRLETALLAPVYANIEERYDLIKKTALETVVNLEYRAACWSLFLTYRDRPESQEILLSLALSGLGRVGGFGSTMGRSEPSR
jgi:LPS-assembly protein